MFIASSACVFSSDSVTFWIRDRMQTVSYNGANTTVIRSKTGFLTSVGFDEGEAVISAMVGFPAGWEITTDDIVIHQSASCCSGTGRR